MESRIYLDNAATSWPKPPTVLSQLDAFYRDIGVSAGRGNSGRTLDLAQRIEQVRHSVAQMIHADHSSEIVFTFSGTDSLSTAILGGLRDGDHVVTTVIEHNSILRPLRFLQENRSVRVTRVTCDSNGLVDPLALKAAIRTDTRMVALSHASNVTGKVQNLQAISEICRDANVLFLVDAAQTLGYLDIDLQQTPCDLMAAPGHKGLLGPLGTGVLYLRSDKAGQVMPLRFGGTGTSSESDQQPEQPPHKYESGNVNAAGILAMGAGIEWVQSEAYPAARQQQQQSAYTLFQELQSIKGLQVLGHFDPEKDAPIISVNTLDLDCREFATILDTTFGIQCRAGFHCAPLIHSLIGSSEHGTLRLSPSLEIRPEQIEWVIDALRQVSESLV